MRESSQQNHRVASTSAVLGIAIVGTVLAFAIGAQAGALLNGRVTNFSVAGDPMR